MKEEDKSFRTIVQIPKWEKTMHKDQRFVMLGSCFAQNIGELFQSYGLDVCYNPLGVTYNPLSIAIQVKQALTGGSDVPVFRADDNVWRCWWANTLVFATQENTLREKVGQTFQRLGDALRNADYLFLTLGTNVYYRLREESIIVANCHKQPHALFEELAIDTETCTSTLCNMMNLLIEECPKLHVVFTVSPYRYKKYSFHGSQLAKATLLLSIDKVCKLYPTKASYFPAYELLLDDLRDYRFYAEDMIHPSSVAVDYIWQRMVECCMDKEMQDYLEKYEPIRRKQMHRPNIINNV